MVLSLFQTASAQELHGSTLNLALGIGGRQLSVFHINYEFDVAPAVTLAPFVSFYDYSNFIPIGVKGSFYFDNMLQINSSWDLYVAGTLGLGIVSDEWDTQYYRDRYNFRGPNAIFIDFHLGAEIPFHAPGRHVPGLVQRRIHHWNRASLIRRSRFTLTTEANEDEWFYNRSVIIDIIPRK